MPRLRNDQSTPKRVLDSTVFIVGEVVVLTLLLLALGNEFFQRYTVQQEITSLRDDVTGLESSNGELSSLVSYLQSDYYREYEARTKLGLQREGETALVLPQDASGETIAESTTGRQPAVLGKTTTTSNTDRALSSTQRWWNYFFGEQSQ